MTLSIDGGPEHQVTAKLWVQALNELGIPYPWVEATALDAGDAIASGEYESIFYIQEPQRTPERVEKLGAALQRLRVWAEYESLYGERFSVAWSWPVGVVPPEKDAT